MEYFKATVSFVSSNHPQCSGKQIQYISMGYDVGLTKVPKRFGLSSCSRAVTEMLVISW